MFTNVQEGLAVYKAELTVYKEWTDKLVERYGGQKRLAANGGPMAVFSNSEYQKLEVWNGKLLGMRMALGLSAEEDAAIDKEVGILTTA